MSASDSNASGAGLLVRGTWPGAALCPVGWMGVLFVLSSIPGTRLLPDGTVGALFAWLPPAAQNLMHLPAFGVLAFLCCRALATGRGLFTAPGALAAWLLSVSYGVLDEWHQSWVVGRYSTLGDLLLDATGAALGLAVYAQLARRAGTV